MTYETYTNLLVKRLEHLGYISRKFGKSLSFYLPNYIKDLRFNRTLKEGAFCVCEKDDEPEKK